MHRHTLSPEFLPTRKPSVNSICSVVRTEYVDASGAQAAQDIVITCIDGMYRRNGVFRHALPISLKRAPGWR